MAKRMLKVKDIQNKDFDEWLKYWTKVKIMDPKYYPK